jgi:hypothetical protein
LILAALLPATAAQAGPGEGCAHRVNNTYDKLLECVTLDGVREHQQALQKIADNSTDPVYPGRVPLAPTGTRTASSTSPAYCGTPATK